MFEFSLYTFRERWQLFVGSILTVAVGVGLMQASLRVLIAAQDPPVPAGASVIEAARIRESYDGATTLMGMTMLLSAFLAIFVVSSTFAFTVAQRRRDLALLRLVGGSKRQLRRLLLSEALLLGACGAVLGVPVGMLALRVQIWLTKELGFLPQDFTVSPSGWVVLATAAAGVVIALLGVRATAWRAAKVRPLEALRDTGAARQVMTPARWVVGLLLAGVAAGLVVLAQAVGSVAALVVAMGFAMIGAVALSLLSPLVVPLTSRVFGFVLRYSTLGRIAEANLREGVRRSASTAAPLIVLISLVLGLFGALSSLTKAAAQEQLDTVNGDLIVRSTGAEAGRVSTVDGVAVASPEIEVPMALTMTVLNADSGEPEEEKYYSGITAIDPAAYQRTHDVSMLAGSLADLSGDTIAATLISEHRAEIGTTASAELDGRTLALRLVGTMPEGLASGESFLVPLSVVPPDVLAGAPAETVVVLADGADPAAVTKTLRGKGFEVSTVADWVASTSARREQDDVGIMVVLMGLAGLYTALAVVNSVVIAYAARRHEFATARVTGLKRVQVVRMALIESCAVTFIGLFLGGLVVAGTLLGVGAATGSALGTPVVAVPWTLGSILAAGAFVVTSVTSVLTTLSATRPRPVTLVAARE